MRKSFQQVIAEDAGKSIQARLSDIGVMSFGGIYSIVAIAAIYHAVATEVSLHSLHPFMGVMLAVIGIEGVLMAISISIIAPVVILWNLYKIIF